MRGAQLRGIEYRLPVASAQVKSCLLLAGLLADGADDRDRAAPDPRPHRAHAARRRGVVRTENAGTPVTIHGELPAQRVTVEPAERLEPGEIAVPGDFSSAAFFLVAALLVARQRGPARGRRDQPGPDRPARDPRPGWGRRSR